MWPPHYTSNPCTYIYNSCTIHCQLACSEKINPPVKIDSHFTSIRLLGYPHMLVIQSFPQATIGGPPCTIHFCYLVLIMGQHLVNMGLLLGKIQEMEEECLPYFLKDLTSIGPTKFPMFSSMQSITLPSVAALMIMSILHLSPW